MIIANTIMIVNNIADAVNNNCTDDTDIANDSYT